MEGTLSADACIDAGVTADRRRWTGWLTAVLVAGLVPRCVVAFLPEEQLLGKVADDAGYYLQLAAEVGRTGVPSMDGVHATNGFHPLWLGVMVPVTTAVGDPTTRLRLAVLLGVLCAVATFVLLARVLVPRVGPGATAIGLALWWLGPRSLDSASSGLEASLGALMVVVLVWAAFRYRDAPDVRAAAVVGLAAAGVYLSRSDAALAVVGVFIWLGAAQLSSTRPRSATLRDASAAALVGTATCLPWWWWNLANFGTLQQASAWAVPGVLWRQPSIDSDEPVIVAVRSSWEFLVDVGPRWIGVPLWLMAVVLGGAAWTQLRRVGSVSARSVLGLGLWLIAAGTVLAVLHAGVRLYPRDYYFEWVRVAWALVAAALVAALGATARGEELRRTAERLPRVVLVAVGASALAVIGAGMLVYARTSAPYPWQTSYVAAARWIGSSTDEDARIGSFNSGLLSMYSGRAVVNLDGVANNAAANAVGRDDLAAYVCDQDLDWFVDIDPYFVDLYRPVLGADAERWTLDPVRTFRGPLDRQPRPSEVTLLRSRCGQ